MQGHEAHHFILLALCVLHNQADVFHEPRKGLELFHGGDQFFQILQASRCVRLFLDPCLPHLRVAGFVEDGFGKLRVVAVLGHSAPALKIVNDRRQRAFRLRPKLIRRQNVESGRIK